MPKRKSDKSVKAWTDKVRHRLAAIRNELAAGSDARMAREAGVPRTTLMTWMPTSAQRSLPTARYLFALSTRYGISVDALLADDEETGFVLRDQQRSSRDLEADLLTAVSAHLSGDIAALATVGSVSKRAMIESLARQVESEGRLWIDWRRKLDELAEWAAIEARARIAELESAFGNATGSHAVMLANRMEGYWKQGLRMIAEEDRPSYPQTALVQMSSLVLSVPYTDQRYTVELELPLSDNAKSEFIRWFIAMLARSVKEMGVSKETWNAIEHHLHEKARLGWLYRGMPDGDALKKLLEAQKGPPSTTIAAASRRSKRKSGRRRP
jgi:transcriptional regulator with XRE-family HTH domain